MKEIVGFFFVLVLTCHLCATTDKYDGAFSYKVESPNKKFVFIMLAPEADDLGPLSKEQREMVREIRRTYKRSGVYLNNGSALPEWPVDWYSESVLVASSGHALVRFNRHPAAGGASDASPLDGKPFHQEAVAVFKDGKEIACYAIDELTKNLGSLKRSRSHIQWIRNYRFVDDEKRVELNLTNGEKIVLDVGTGSLKRP